MKFWYFVALTTSGSFWLKQSLSTVNSSVQKFNRLLIWKKVLIQIYPQWSTIGNCYHWFINLEVRKTAGGGGRREEAGYDVRLNLTGKDENAISETLYFKIFQGNIPPDSPRSSRLRRSLLASSVNLPFLRHWIRSEGTRNWKGLSVHGFSELRVFSSPGLTGYSSKPPPKNARQLQSGVYRSYEKITLIPMTQKLILPPSRATNVPLDVWSFFSPRQMLSTPRTSAQ